MAFPFTRQGSAAAIVHDGTPIIRFESNFLFFNGTFWARDQWLEPGGGPEVASLPLFSCLASPVSDVEYQAETLPDGLRLRITPSQTRRGRAPLARLQEVDTLTVRLAGGRYVWTQEMELRAGADLNVDDPATGQVLQIYHFPRPDGQPGLYLQYADPQPINASGPAVPMARDWLGQIEPYIGPDGFRQHWRRRYVAILFQDPDGSYAHSDLNKTKWHHLTLDNRRARPCHAQGMVYVLKEDGSALAGRCRAPSHFHHVCEWGMDFHYWLDLEPYLRGRVLPAATEIRAATEWRLADAAETAPLVRQARRIELTADERRWADLPAYEEPENTFAVSALDRLDAQPWSPGGEGCAWERTGGRTPGSGCLAVRNVVTTEGEWRQPSLGPSQWGNPLVPGAKYRLSAWVKLDDLTWNAGHPGPLLGVTFQQYNGPASASPPTTIVGGWSAPLFGAARGYPPRLDWTRIELVTTAPSYALVACLHLRFCGRGTARFSGVRWEQIED